MDNTFNDNEFPVDYSGPENTAKPDVPFQNTPEPEPAFDPPYAEQQEPPFAPQIPYTPQPEGTFPPPSSTYSGKGTGRKESPYADSPYVMHHPPQTPPQYHYQAPHQAPPQPPVPPKPKKAPKKPGAGKRVLAAILALVLLGGICGGFGFLVHTIQENNQAHNAQMKVLTDRIAELEDQLEAAASTTPGAPTSRPAEGPGMSPSELYYANVNSVVAIYTTIQAQSFYGPTEGSSSGSGFILSAEGYVVTNAHVVEGATAISVILHDGSEYAADMVGSDSSNDIAVLKLQQEVPGLVPAVLGSSSDMAIGDMVAAIGNPLGELSSTQTIGYISGINREVTTDNTIISMIQTDAAINPGNSGGPLFNMYGEVIGITTAKYSGTTGSGASIEGIGFAIPIDDVKGMFQDLISYGYVTGAYLGVTVQDMDPEVVSKYGVPNGAYVVTVVDGISADRAGVLPKDIIIAIGDYEVSSVTSLTRSLRNFKAGDTTTITVVRGGKELTLEITLDEKPRDTSATAPTYPDDMPEGDPNEWFDYFRRYFGG